MQGLALGTLDILEALGACGVEVTHLVATGGLATSALYLQEHANATGRPVHLLREPEAMLLGSAMVRGPSVYRSSGCTSALLLASTHFALAWSRVSSAESAVPRPSVARQWRVRTMPWLWRVRTMPWLWAATIRCAQNALRTGFKLTPKVHILLYLLLARARWLPLQRAPLLPCTLPAPPCPAWCGPPPTFPRHAPGPAPSLRASGPCTKPCSSTSESTAPSWRQRPLELQATEASGAAYLTCLFVLVIE